MIIMKLFLFSSFCFLCFGLLSHRVLSETQSKGGSDHASFPPRGWNSYDSFSWIISEQEFLQNAEIVSNRLLSHGYEYVVVDFLWFRRKVKGAYTDSLGFDVIDEWGRVIPAPDRWPSSQGGKGFIEVGNKVHSLGLKFGIHVMRGISTQAVNANTPILDTITGRGYEESGRKWFAKDIGIKERSCGWMQNGFMSVNTELGAGRAFLRSLYRQYADWGVDFVKHDCVFGDDLDVSEVSFVSELLKQLDHPILYSVSPGTSATPNMAKAVNGLVNMYRVSGDDWDSWGDVVAHFDIARDFSVANMIGATGLLGKSWPDLDMLPLGWLTDPGSNYGPHRISRLNLDEQKTQITLWSMAKSPLMFGGDLRKLDETTYNLITNPTLLEINSFSSNNMEFPSVTSEKVSVKREPAFSSKSGRYLTNLRTTVSNVMGLTSCTDLKAMSWFIEDQNQGSEKLCWKENSGSNHLPPFCLYKRESRSDIEKEIFIKQHDKRRLLLSATERMELCLDTSPKRRLRAEEFRRASFSPCINHANQIWDLNSNGTLVNSYSGQCAVINPTEAKVISNGVRSWVATGRTGEIYVAFFNLNTVKTVISAKISDLAKALPGKNLEESSCKYREVWSEDFGETKQLVSTTVEVHGCAIFVLICN